MILWTVVRLASEWPREDVLAVKCLGTLAMIPDGKPENKFAFDGEYQNAEFATKIIAETHEYWRQLVGIAETAEDGGKLDISCVAVEGSKVALTRDEASALMGA